MERLPSQGDLNWRLSAHPITLLFFLGFRIGKSAKRSDRNRETEAYNRHRKSVNVPLRRPLHRQLVRPPPLPINLTYD